MQSLLAVLENKAILGKSTESFMEDVQQKMATVNGVVELFVSLAMIGGHSLLIIARIN